MAKSKKIVDDLLNKYTVKKYTFDGKNTPTSTPKKTTTKTNSKPISNKSDNREQNNSSASTVDEILNKYPVKKNKTFTTRAEVSTPKKYTDFNAETKKAYTSAKDKVYSKTTIENGMSEKERKARIKEIDSELTNLTRQKTGLSRAGAYGNSQALISKGEELDKKIAELSEEKKTLERVGTFSASELKQFEIDDAKKEVSRARNKVNYFGRPTLNTVEAYKSAVSERYNAQQKLDLLEREKAQLKQIERLNELNAHTKAVTSKKDYSQNSKYSPIVPKTDAELKAEGYKQDPDGKWYKTLGISGIRQTYTGEDSDLYTYINDESRRDSIDTDKRMLTGTTTYRDMGYHTLTDEEKGAFNYLYHQDRKNGTNTAEKYLSKISPLLQQRAMEQEALTYKTISKESPVVMSALSLGTNLQNAAMFPIKAVATATGTYEDMPLLDMYGNRTQSIRGGVSEDMGFWGGLGYNAAMSIGDMGVAMLAGGGNAKAIQAIMSSAAGSSTISEAKKNGASDGKALVLGLGSAAIEWATERYSVEAILKDPQTIKGFILTNTLTEATEEGASNLGNMALDAIVSEVFGERNEIEQMIDYLVLYEGKSEEEALQIAFTDKLKSLGEDILVGGLTGFGMSGAKASAIGVENAINNRRYETSFMEDGEMLDGAKAESTPPDSLEQAAKDVVEARNATQQTVRKGTPLAERLEAQSLNNEPITVEDVKRATGFGDEGAKLVTELANNEGVTFSQAEKTVKTAYLTGYSNVEGTSVNFVSDTQINAFTAGKKDRAMQDIADKENAKKATIYDGAFTENEYTKNYTPAEKKMVSTVAKSLGMDIETVDKIIANEFTGAEANASHTDGKMQISSTANKVVSKLVLHEGGHRMKQLAPTEFGILMDALYARADGRSISMGVSKGLMFDDIKSKHDRAGITLNTGGYLEEFAVRELETIFESAEAFNSWYSEISGNQQVKSAWQKFMDFVSELIEEIKRFVANRKLSKTERAEARKELAELERIKELYTNVYKASEKAVAERRNEGKVADAKSDSNFSLKEDVVEQKITSANTSIKQIPALFKNKDVTFGKTNIDIGGGRFDLATEYLKEQGTKNYLFDPYNRSKATNTQTLSFLQNGNKADTATCANVLNVIAEPKARANVILEMAKAIKSDGKAYFMVYEGDGTGVGKKTSSGWQNNRKTADYMREISKYFENVERKGKLIIATNPKANLPKAYWEVTQGEGVMYSLKEKDTEYLELAKDPKKNEARLREMVEEAAKNAGYIGTYYHGSKSDFTVFKKEFGGASNSNASIGFWFTESEEGAKKWADNSWWGDNEKGKVYKTYLRLNNPKVYETVDTKAQRDELYKGYESIDKEMTLYDAIYYFDYGRRYHTERYDYDKSKRRSSGIAEWDAFKAIVKKYDADTIEHYLSKVAESEREIVKKDAERYLELSKERKALEKQITELRYSDAYELFRTDMYKQIGLGAEDANIGGTGKYVENKDEMLKKYADMLKQEGYDGIIIKGTAYDTNTFGENNNQYLVLDSNQVKSADLVTYDDKGNIIPLSERFNKKNDDIRFSLKEPVEETKDLVAVHNLWEEKLLKSLNLGGLPMPSIAIVKAREGHSNFGNISLVFRKETISPTDRRNKVYSGDAWTPTYPHIEYKLNTKAQEEIEKKINGLVPRDIQRVLGGLYLDEDNMESTLNRNGDLASSYNYNFAMKYAFLRDSGIEFDLPMKNASLSSGGQRSDEAIIKIAETVPEEVLRNAIEGESTDKKYESEPVIRKAVAEAVQEKYKDKPVVLKALISKYDEELSLGQLMGYAEDAIRYKEEGVKQEVDYKEASNLIDEKTDTAEYEKWLKELFSDVIAKEGIRNDKDLFTPSGNRRSFEALHYEHTLENVVKAMREQGSIGIGGFGGNNILGSSAVEYGSISEIKEKANERMKSLPQEEYDKIRAGFTDRFFELAGSLPIHKDSFSAMDEAANMLCEAVMKYKTKSGMANYLRNESKGWANYSDHIVDDLVELVNDIRNMPTSYFEAKPQRAVGFNEIATAVIPDNVSEELKTKLKEANVRFVEYEHGNEEARIEALNSIEDVKFSLKETDNTSTKAQKELLDTIEHLKGEFEVTKFAKADPKKLAKMTKDVLKEYYSKADFDETYKAIDELYKYMANGEDGYPAVWDEVYSRAYDIARNIVENAVVNDDYMYQSYKHLRDYLRNTPMKFTEYDSVPSSYENFNDFRKQNMGRLKFTKDGRGIDTVYQELSSLYPEFFSEDEYSSADQLERMIDVLDELRPTTMNPFDRQIEQVSMQVANDLTSRFFDIPQAKPTFADKAERRVTAERIRGGKKVEAVRLQRDEKIKKLVESQKEKTKKQLDKLRQQRDAKVEKEKVKRRDAFAKMSESKKAKELRARIIRHTGELNKTLLKATDKKHIPPELENAVVALLYNINLESNYSYDVASNSYKKNDEGLPTNKTKAFRELKEVYEAIAKNNDYGLTIASELFDATGEGVSNIFDDVMKLSDKKIADMTSQELTLIYDTIRLVEHSITTANKMFAMQKWEGLSETAKAFEKSVATRRAKNPLRTNYTIDIETPITFFSHFGEAGLELYEALRNAQDNGQMMIDEITEIIEGIVSLEDVQKANKEIHEFTTTGGKKLTLSKAHIMDIYLLYNRNQGKKHLLYDPDSEYFGKGIRQPEIKSKKIGRGTENIRLTKTDIGNIISKLSEQDKAIADKMQKATLKLAEWGNKACMEVFGYEKFNDPDYWTIKSAPEGTNKSVEKNKNTERSIKNMGSAKQTDAKATNALEIGGIFDVFNQHASDMICYSSWLAVVEDATKLYNFTLRDEFGNKTDVTFQDLLNKYAGNGGSDYYFNLLSDIQNGIGTKPDTRIERIYTSLYGAAAKAKVAFKATVVAQQPMAIVRASSVLNPLSIMQAIGKGGVNLPVWAVSKAKNLVAKDAKASEWYGGWQRALKYSPIAARKAVGGYEINSNSSGLESVLYKPKTVKGKTIDALKESPLWAAGKADEISWGVLWNACEIETSKNKSLKKGSDTYYEAVAKLFNKVINETQVVDGVLQRSQIMRSSSGWIKPATAFKGEPIMALNGIIRAYDNLRYETNPAKRGKAIKSFSRSVSVFVASAIFTAFARSLAVGVIGDDDEEYWKKVWKSFSGVQGDEETWFDFVKNVGLKSDVVNNMNPLSWLPIASEMMSALQGYDVERLDVASIGEFVNAGTTFINSLDKEGKNTVPYATRNLLLKFSELTGYSPYNLVRDIEGAIKTTRVETNDVRGLYDMEKWRTKPASNTSKYIDILFKAYSTDHEAYEDIYDDLIASGVDADKIKSGMETRMKKAEGVEKASELSKRYMTPDDEKKYDTNLKKVKSSRAWKSANAKQRKEAEADLYDILTATGESAEKKRAELKEYGIDETDYVLWELAKEIVDKPTESGKLGTYNNAELADALSNMDLDYDTEWALYLSGKDTETARKAQQYGLDAELYAQARYDMDNIYGDYIYNGQRVDGSLLTSSERKEAKIVKNSRRDKIVDYLNSVCGSEKEYLYLLGTEFDSIKDDSDYVKYFGK